MELDDALMHNVAEATVEELTESTPVSWGR